jgi:hypothetical protein
MAKIFTQHDSVGLSDSEIKINQQDKGSSPSKEALRFVLAYAKSSTVVKSNSLDTVVLFKN